MCLVGSNPTLSARTTQARPPNRRVGPPNPREQAGVAQPPGEVLEWPIRHAWKACRGASPSWVRIPPSPPPPHTHALPHQRSRRPSISSPRKRGEGAAPQIFLPPLAGGDAAGRGGPPATHNRRDPPIHLRRRQTSPPPGKMPRPKFSPPACGGRCRRQKGAAGHARPAPAADPLLCPASLRKESAVTTDEASRQTEHTNAALRAVVDAAERDARAALADARNARADLKDSYPEPSHEARPRVRARQLRVLAAPDRAAPDARSTRSG